MGCSQCQTNNEPRKSNKKENKKEKKAENTSDSGKKEVKNDENKIESKIISIPNKEKGKVFNNVLLSKQVIIKEEEKKSNQEKEEKKEEEKNYNQEKEEKKEEEKNSNQEQEEKKEEEKKSNQEQEDKKEDKNISLSNNNNDSEQYDNPLFKIKNMANFVYCKNSIHTFLIDDEPLKKYNYFKIDFTSCNYIFIIPEQFYSMFSNFYQYRLKNSIIFFPKDYKEANNLLNDLENEEETKENWIMICPCMELENNIQTLNEKKNIYHIVAYCPFLEHGENEHNFKFFVKFQKFYGIVNSYHELIIKLFKLNNIFYFRERQKYEIDNDNNNNNINMELKYDTKYLIDFNNDCSKNNATDDKLLEFFSFKINNDNCYFAFIQSYNFLKNCIEEKKFDLLYNIFENLSGILFISNDELEKTLLATNILKNLHLLYLYFSNYPYLYGVLTDEEMSEILSQFKPDVEQIELESIFASGYNLLIHTAEALASQIDKGISILNKKQELKLLQKLLIELNLSNAQLIDKYNVSELIEFYQIKNYLRDIDFCLGVAILDIIHNACRNYPSEFEITPSYMNKEKRLIFYKVYSIEAKKINDIEDEQAEAYNKAIKYNDTIVLGDTNFHELIKKIDIPCENIYYLNEEQFSNFFKVPKKIKNKYKICKFFIIMNEKNGNKYMETIRYISNVFGLKFATIIYVENKNTKIHKKIQQDPLIHMIITYSEKDILNYYCDTIARIKELNVNYLDENEMYEQKLFGINYVFPKMDEIKIFKEEDNGWDMVRDINTNIFNYVNVLKFLGYIDVAKFNKDMYKVYKENNCLDLFIKYYGNYFGGEYLIEQITSLDAIVKMFLYAYTIEELNGKVSILL